MINHTRNIGVKLLLIRAIFVSLSLWLSFSIYYSQMKGVYLSVVMLLVFAIPTIDQITMNENDASFERFYVYSFIKLTWRVGDKSNFRFGLYTGNEYGMPESYDPAIDLIAPFIFRYKSQGILVSKGTTKWTYRSANFGLHDHEFAMISELLRKMHPST